MIRTDTDMPLAQYRYKGKLLLEMSEQELAAMMLDQDRKPDALFEFVSMRQSPAVVPAEMAYARHPEWSRDWQNQNRLFILENKDLVARMMAAHSIAKPPPLGAEAEHFPAAGARGFYPNSGIEAV